MLHIPVWRQVTVFLTVVVGLLLAMPNAFYTRVEQSNDARAIIAGGVSDDALAAQAAQWPSFLPSGLVNLGLDLRGGAHLLAEVQVADVYAARMEAMWPEVRDVLAAERETLGFVTREEGGPQDALRMRITNAEALPRALELVRGLGRPIVSLTGIGGTDLDVRAENGVIIVTLSAEERQATDSRTVQQSLEIIRRRIDEVGTREPTIQRQGEDRILVQVPGVGSARTTSGSPCSGRPWSASPSTSGRLVSWPST